MAIDPLAEQAFGSRADEYERHRPGWPGEAVERALSELGLGPQSTVLDLAAGTGKLARELVPRTGRVIAVEPSDDMLGRLTALVPGVDALLGTAEAIPLAGGSVDGVFVGDAFHWFATREAVGEIARVLTADGGLALLWKVHDFGDEPWVRRMGELLDARRARGVTEANRKHTGRWRAAFDGAPFSPLQEFAVRQEQRTDRDGFLAHVATWSFVAALPDDARAEVLHDLGQLLARVHPSPDDIVIPYRTEVHWTRRA